MSARHDLTSGATFGLAQVAVIGLGLVVAWKLFAPQLLAFAGAAGAAAGAEASSQITSGVSGAAPGIGTQIGTAAGSSAVDAAKDSVFGEAGGPVTYGGVPVDVTT